jgi:hypothetical protein
LDESTGLRDTAAELDAAVHRSGLRGSFSSTLRTNAEQARLYKRFLAGASQFPAAPPGGSAHEYGLAFDYVVSPWSAQSAVGQWARENLGLAWSPNDAVHFEVPGASEWAMQQGAALAAAKATPWWQDWWSFFLPSKATDTGQAMSDKIFTNPVTGQKESAFDVFSGWYRN